MSEKSNTHQMNTHYDSQPLLFKEILSFISYSVITKNRIRVFVFHSNSIAKHHSLY